MAKFTPGLMGAKTTPDFGGKSSIDGYDNSGDALLDSAIKGSIAQTNRNKAVKFQQAQVLRDGIVSGHFSDDMVTQVEGALDRMAKLNPNGKNYSKVLNKANAELGMTVQKQAQVTDLLKRTSDAFEGDEDKKYYSKDNFFALLEDNTSLDLDSAAMKNAYKGYLKSTENINEDVVREDFIDLLGKYKFGYGGKTEEGEIGGVKTMINSSSQGERTQMYKLESGVSVPVYTDSSLVPEDLVEKWGTSSKAHIAMMDNYVDKKLAGKSYTGEELKAQELALKKEFVLEQMKQVIPDYASISQKRESALPGQGGGSNNKPNPSSLVATQISRALLGDQSIIGNNSRTSMMFENTKLQGFDITNQFKDIKLIPGIGKSPGRPATKIFRPTNEDALYIDTGRGVVRYDESQFNDLMIMASSAGNGFTMDDANSLPEYNNTSKSFNIRQTVTDGTTTKNISELTSAEAQSGKWSPANQSLVGTKYQKYQMTDENASNERSQQKIAGSALSQIEGFSIEQMNNDNLNYDNVTEMGKALNTSWSGQVVPGISMTKTIKSIKTGVNAVGSLGFGAGRDKFVVRFNDGSDKIISQDVMRTLVLGQF
jgi:hypothetical protein